MFDRSRIADGRHLPDLAVDEDASSAAGIAQVRVTCSYGRMPQRTPEARDRALAAHTAHVNTVSRPAVKGQAWRSAGARVGMALVAVLLVWGTYAAGQFVLQEQLLAAGGAKVVVAGVLIGGIGLAFGLTVAAVRRLVARNRT
ncbi:hypothetical protein [Streptomyces sp. CNQ431]|uniref:hypothetical protein n=1 Tax=Streptomyces sp. CNQ431 TaxID=1571532 RepID=UPI00053D8796|nr:hypothetical protein [Streptomyces sp. CNQ431]